VHSSSSTSGVPAAQWSHGALYVRPLLSFTLEAKLLFTALNDGAGGPVCAASPSPAAAIAAAVSTLRACLHSFLCPGLPCSECIISILQPQSHLDHADEIESRKKSAAPRVKLARGAAEAHAVAPGTHAIGRVAGVVIGE
jgi:hypothetical protein